MVLVRVREASAGAAQSCRHMKIIRQLPGVLIGLGQGCSVLGMGRPAGLTRPPELSYRAQPPSVPPLLPGWPYDLLQTACACRAWQGGRPARNAPLLEIPARALCLEPGQVIKGCPLRCNSPGSAIIYFPVSGCSGGGCGTTSRPGSRPWRPWPPGT